MASDYPDGTLFDRRDAPRISVIMPVLGESARIIDAIRLVHDAGDWYELIVVDGRSEDGTASLARSTGRCRVIASDRGRGAQMNAGAGAATGNLLLFLHADVRLPMGAGALIEAVARDERYVGGAFKTWTVPEAEAPWWAPAIHLADLRSRYTRWPYGDQAVFVRRSAFDAVGGFPAQPIMEDLEFSRRLARIGRLKRVDARVLVSGRRLLARPIFYFVAMNIIPLLYGAGVSGERLERWYGAVR